MATLHRAFFATAWPLFLWFAFLTALPVAAAPPQVKNVLLLVADDLKASVLHCYGDKVCATPNLDRLAARGVVFERAYCQGTVCRPSRTSFMRSRYTDKRGATLGEHLIGQRFTTARVGKIFHMKVPGDIIAGTNGQDVAACWSERYNASGKEAHSPGDYACLNLNIFTSELAGRQSTAMPHRMFVSVRLPGDGADQPDWKAATKSIQLLNRFSKQDQRFLLATGFVRPHYPHVAPDRVFRTYPYKAMRLPEVPQDDLLDIPSAGISGSTSANRGIDKYPENQQRMWSAYYATVTFMDQQVGRVLDELDRLGLADSTAIVFTSDHGYHLGEHHFWQKGNLHEEVTRVPLIIAAPGVKAGRSRSITELIDIYPTICELTRSAIPPSVQGTSLVPVLLDNSVTVRQAAVSYVAKGQSLRTDRWAYMRYKNGGEELYDMQTDPGQFQNLASRPEFETVRQSLSEMLSQRLVASAK